MKAHHRGLYDFPVIVLCLTSVHINLQSKEHRILIVITTPNIDVHSTKLIHTPAKFQNNIDCFCYLRW